MDRKVLVLKDIKFDSLKVIEYLFYLLILLYFVGKLFKPITLFIDITFIYYALKNKEIIKEYFYKYKALFISFGIYVFYILAQSLFVDYKVQSLKSSLETILYVILFFAVLKVFDTKEKLKKVFYVSFFILAFISIDSLYQFYTGYDFFGVPMYENGLRISAWNNTPKVGLMMGEFFGLLVCSLFIFKSKQRVLAFIVFSLVLVVFILSGNRSPILAIVSSFLIIAIFSKYRKYLLTFLAIFTFVFALSFFNEKLNSAYSKLFNPTSNEATHGRFIIYSTALEIIKDYPILGIGSHNYEYYHLEYVKKLDWKGEDSFSKYFLSHAPKHVHSVFLDIILSYGFLGTIIFLGLLYTIYNKFIKNNQLGLLASIGFLYCITPLQFAKNFTQGDWQFITYLGLIFLVLISINYEKTYFNGNETKS